MYHTNQSTSSFSYQALSVKSGDWQKKVQDDNGTRMDDGLLTRTGQYIVYSTHIGAFFSLFWAQFFRCVLL